MFALEIEFHDGISSPETIFVRRNNAVIGASEQAHVVIEGAGAGVSDFRVIRGLGREFRCQGVRRSGRESGPLPFLEGTYRDQAELKLGEITVRITALDIDLCLLPDEFPDRAATRVLRSACIAPSPLFPAIAVLGPTPVFVSFSEGEPVTVGRSRKCGVRLDAADVSAEHARIGFDGEYCWVEDLGSTNSTLVAGERVSGRRKLLEKEVITIGSGFSLMVVNGPADMAGIAQSEEEAPRIEAEVSYPCILTASEIVRPQRVALQNSGTLRLGRDAACDLWVNAPHISRHHLDIRWEPNGRIFVTDRSSNGSYLWSERLPKGQEYELPGGMCLLDLCSGILLAVCRTAGDERTFQRNGVDSPHAENSVRLGEDLETGIFTVPESASSGGLDALVQDSGSGEALPASGVFHSLARRAANQAQMPPFAASEENVHSVPRHSEMLADSQVGAENGGTVDVQALEPHGRLAGILDDEQVSSELNSELARQFEDASGEHSAQSAMSSQFDLSGQDVRSSGNFLRVVLILGGISLVIFCVLLVGWMLSEALFYQ